MIEKLKYHLAGIINGRKMRIGCVAVMTAMTIVAVTLLSSSIHTVEIFDGEKTYTVRTLSKNTANAFSSVSLKHDDYNIVETKVNGSTTSISIEYTYPVYVTNADKVTEIEFAGGTVKEALALAGFTVDKYDYVEPSADTVINGTEYIDYVNIDYVNGTYEETIPFGTDTVYSSTQKKGVTTTTQGQNGIKQISYTEKLVNGVSAEKTVTASKVIKGAVNAKKVIGTKTVAASASVNKSDKAVKTSNDVKSISVLKPPFEIELDKNGNPVKYKSKRIARATAYTYTGNNCSTGVAPKPGYIAVNPKVIPYGTKMYIKTADGRYIYGYAVAADTGGFIRKYPTGVDLFMSTESACVSFGVRNVEIYILE